MIGTTCLIGEGNGNPLQYSYLENPMDGGAWLATVHGVAESQTRLSDFTYSLTYLLRLYWPYSRSLNFLNVVFFCLLNFYSFYQNCVLWRSTLIRMKYRYMWQWWWQWWWWNLLVLTFHKWLSISMDFLIYSLYQCYRY